MDERVIALTDLTKQYGRFTAVDRGKNYNAPW